VGRRHAVHANRENVRISSDDFDGLPAGVIGELEDGDRSSACNPELRSANRDRSVRRSDHPLQRAPERRRVKVGRTALEEETPVRKRDELGFVTRASGCVGGGDGVPLALARNACDAGLEPVPARIDRHA
jgi:hypothetical protein